MAGYLDIIGHLNGQGADRQLEKLYGTSAGMVEKQRARYADLAALHERLYHTGGDILLISAPGRSEIGGNHTDHNLGKVLAASVNLDALAAVSFRDDSVVRLKSDGYDEIVLDLEDTAVRLNEKGTTAALIRGVASGMLQKGYKIGGFDACVTSTVASGSGLSSSAAFEMLICAIFDKLYNGWRVDPIERAKIGQYAENQYFGKPSGLLDQMASSAGGLVTVDFGPAEPAVRTLSYDFSAKGISIVVVSTGGSHANLTPCYAAIPDEMKRTASCLGGSCLRDVPEERFMASVGSLRGKVSDRAILRAMHFYEENHRVERQVAALEADDPDAFLKEIVDSGRSSYMYLQNVYPDPDNQNLSLALALAEKQLKGRGAWRVHGGGFAGTTLNFVPENMLDEFIRTMESVFGQGSCQVLAIRPVGPAVLEV